MASPNFHSKPFSKETILKLEIFEAYADAWLPVFPMAGFLRIQIFDLFAGPGYDKNGIPGSAIRILQQIHSHINTLAAKKVTIDLYLNEIDDTKHSTLVESVNTYLDEHPALRRVLQIIPTNLDAEHVLSEATGKLGSIPSLVYLDQSGIKFIARRILERLINSEKTDALLFTASSYVRRFGMRPEFREHIDYLNIERISAVRPDLVHRAIVDQLNETIPTASSYGFYGFSIKKGRNVYGIIFGASHPLAVDKFLTIAWNRNRVNGDANFDIDDDAVVSTHNSLFDEYFSSRPSRIERFEQQVKALLLTRQITNNLNLYMHCLRSGFLGSHGNKVVRQMQKDNKLNIKGTVAHVNYQSWKKELIVEFEPIN